MADDDLLIKIAVVVVALELLGVPVISMITEEILGGIADGINPF